MEAAKAERSVERVIPTPGHTPGSVSVLLDSGEAIVGDVVMGKLMGLLHRPGPPIVAWDLARNRESVRWLLALSPRVIYVSHGGLFEDLSGLVKKQLRLLYSEGKETRDKFQSVMDCIGRRWRPVVLLAVPAQVVV